MGYLRVPFNTTKLITNKGNILTGSHDAIFLRNKYQPELDNAHAAIVNQVHYVEERSNEAKELFNKAQGLKRNIEAHISERGSLYETLGNLLNKETNFEFEMWRTTQQNNKVTQLNIKQKFSDSDVDEMRFDSMLEYLKQYPTYASKTTFKDIIDKIQAKEGEIRKEKEYYITTVSEYNTQLSTFEKELIKAGDKFNAYDKVFKEGTEKLANTRYRDSIFYKLASEKNKAEVNLDTLSHRVEQFQNTLDLIKNDYALYKSRNLTELEY
jgi:hypothetical protein